jgi:RNA polymerase sigma factor (sigma-70 family)
MTDAIAELRKQAIERLTAEEEQDLLAYAKAGSAGARETLIRSQIPTVLFAARLAGNAEDAIQDAMIALCRCVDRFDGRVRLVSYAYQRIHGAIQSQRRSYLKTKQGHVPLDDEEKALQIPDPSPSPDESAEAADTALDVVAALEKLRPKTAEMVRAYYGIGCDPQTFAEVGKAHGVSPQSAQQTIARGLEKLRWLLK